MERKNKQKQQHPAPQQPTTVVAPVEPKTYDLEVHLAQIQDTKQLRLDKTTCTSTDLAKLCTVEDFKCVQKSLLGDELPHKILLADANQMETTDQEIKICVPYARQGNQKIQSWILQATKQMPDDKPMIILLTKQIPTNFTVAPLTTASLHQEQQQQLHTEEKIQSLIEEKSKLEELYEQERLKVCRLKVDGEQLEEQNTPHLQRSYQTYLRCLIEEYRSTVFLKYINFFRQIIHEGKTHFRTIQISRITQAMDEMNVGMYKAYTPYQAKTFMIRFLNFLLNTDGMIINGTERWAIELSLNAWNGHDQAYTRFCAEIHYADKKKVDEAIDKYEYTANDDKGWFQYINSKVLWRPR